MELKIDLTGLKRLESQGANISTVLPKAVKAGAVIAQKEISRRAIKRTGTLAGDIIIQVEQLGKLSVKAIVRPGKKGFYGRFLEVGAKSHEIRARKKRVLASGGVVFGTSVSHPGVRKRPFIQPAYDAKENEIRSVIEGMVHSAVTR